MACSQTVQQLYNVMIYHLTNSFQSTETVVYTYIYTGHGYGLQKIISPNSNRYLSSYWGFFFFFFFFFFF
jgi:hypothetical protein